MIYLNKLEHESKFYDAYSQQYFLTLCNVSWNSMMLEPPVVQLFISEG